KPRRRRRRRSGLPPRSKPRCRGSSNGLRIRMAAPGCMPPRPWEALVLRLAPRRRRYVPCWPTNPGGYARPRRRGGRGEGREVVREAAAQSLERVVPEAVVVIVAVSPVLEGLHWLFGPMA